MKRLVATLFSVIIVSGLLVAGCAPAATPDDGGTTPEEEEEDSGTPAQAEDEVIEWLGQHHDAAGGSKNKRFQEFCDRVNLASNGRLKLTLQAGGGIVPATEEFDATHKGLIDFC